MSMPSRAPRRATRLSTWIDVDGMRNLRGRFDPVIGVKLAAALDSAVDTLVAEATPATAPTDPIEKQHHRRALVLAHLLDGTDGGKPGRTEFVVVIDADAPHRPGPVAEFSIPVEIPARVLATSFVALSGKERPVCGRTPLAPSLRPVGFCHHLRPGSKRPDASGCRRIMEAAGPPTTLMMPSRAVTTMDARKRETDDGACDAAGMDAIGDEEQARCGP
jgi:hypothetical protein